MTPDYEQAKRFLTLLGGGAFFSFQSIDDDAGRGDRGLARVLHGTLSQHWRELCRLNARGAGIFVTVNRTDLRGRKASNVVRVRALFVDLDGAPLPKRGPTPHIVVETSLGRWHVYWRVADVKLEEFPDKQRALIELHAGDPAVCDLPRVMRVPGFFHCKRKPRMVRIVTANDELLDYRAADFPTAVSTPARAPDGKRAASRAGNNDAISLYLLTAALEVIPSDNYWPWLEIGAALHFELGDDGFEPFDQWSARSHKYNPNQCRLKWRECAKFTRYTGRTILFYADKAAPGWREEYENSIWQNFLSGYAKPRR
jgi:hypothetical protein